MLQKKLKDLSEGICLGACYYKMMYGNVGTFHDFVVWLGVHIGEGNISEDGFVNNPNKLTRKQVYKSNTNETGKPQIARFYNSRTGCSHFVIAAPNGKVIFDPLGESVTVKEGIIKDWRIVE